MRREPVAGSGPARRWLWPMGLLVLAVGAWWMRGSAPAPATDARHAAEPPRAMETPVPVAPPAAPPPLPAEPPRADRPPQPAAAPRAPGRNSLEELPADPFERQNDQEPEVRTLIAVGDIRLGVLRNARVRDEAALTSALARIGDALDQKGRRPQAGGPGRQELLDSHREELGRYVDGEIEIRGPDWMIGVEVGEQRPLHEVWRPRSNP